MKPSKPNMPPIESPAPSTKASPVKKPMTAEEMADLMVSGMVKNLNANVTKGDQKN